MSAARSTHEAPQSGPNPDMSEDALDTMIEDSFPASDPPSHTPMTALGASKDAIDEGPPARRWARSIAVAGVAALVLMVSVASLLIARRRQQVRADGFSGAVRHGRAWRKAANERRQEWGK